jgi:formamidopyrimidine-DNA glycosylase
VASTEAPIPWLVRTGAAGLETLHGHAFGEIDRQGKFLLFHVDDGRILVINPMLTGRFHWVEPGAKKAPRTGVVITLDDGHELRYSDQRRMGRWYLVPGDGLEQVPQWPKLGPDALALTEDEFTARVMKRRGQIKNVITNQEVFAGVGNAYSDEILWEAQLHPHRARQSMSEDDVRRLYRAMRDTIEWATGVVEGIVAEEGLGKKEEWRQHLRVHRKAGSPCPRCGSEIRGQTRGDSETNYCLTCQPLWE